MRLTVSLKSVDEWTYEANGRIFFGMRGAQAASLLIVAFVLGFWFYLAYGSRIDVERDVRRNLGAVTIAMSVAAWALARARGVKNAPGVTALVLLVMTIVNGTLLARNGEIEGAIGYAVGAGIVPIACFGAVGLYREIRRSPRDYANDSPNGTAQSIDENGWARMDKNDATSAPFGALFRSRNWGAFIQIGLFVAMSIVLFVTSYDRLVEDGDLFEEWGYGVLRWNVVVAGGYALAGALHRRHTHMIAWLVGIMVVFNPILRPQHLKGGEWGVLDAVAAVVFVWAAVVQIRSNKRANDTSSRPKNLAGLAVLCMVVVLAIGTIAIANHREEKRRSRELEELNNLTATATDAAVTVDTVAPTVSSVYVDDEGRSYVNVVDANGDVVRRYIQTDE